VQTAQKAMPQAHITASRSVAQAMTLAAQHFKAGRISAAAALYREVLQVRPDWAPALHQLGILAFKSGDFTTATKLIRRAISAAGANARYHNDLGVVYRVVGQIDAATIEFEKAIALDQREAEYYLNLSHGRTFAAGDPHLTAMEWLVGAITSLPVFSQTQLHFALAKAYDDLGRYDDGFRHLVQGNTLKRSQVVYDETEVLGWFDRIRATFDRALIDARAGAGYPSPLPVFVVGMPRSGTTLVEQILASHPSVHGAGELPDLGSLIERLPPGANGATGYPESVRSLSANEIRELGRAYTLGLRRRAHGAARILDKALSLFLCLGLIHLALPEARIVHVRRNPLDTCLSCYSTLFEVGQNFSYDLAELGRYYRGYAGLMAHWREVLPADHFLEISYEALIADFETEARRLVAFCGLPWDLRCLAFHQTRRPVYTASAVQVRRPIYQSSHDRWQNHRDHLGPLIAALGDLASF
jgi:tetratricopeptide (TPR) repeat protein